MLRTAARVRGLVVIGMIKTVVPLASDRRHRRHAGGQLAGTAQDVEQLLVHIVRLGGARAVLTWRPGHTCPVLSIHIVMLLSHVPHIQWLDVQILRPLSVRTGAAAGGRVGDGAAAGACRHSRLS